MTVKAIETQYAGCRFRSRLEARWAVFFDALGLKWEYEKEGFELPSGRYLPDFWLPSISSWVEIKGERPTKLESQLAQELALATGHRVFVFSGPVPGYDPTDISSAESPDAWLPYTEGGQRVCDTDDSYAFCVCRQCGAVGIEFDGRSDRLHCKECYRCADARRGIDVSGYSVTCPRDGNCVGRCFRSGHGDKGYTPDDERILNAITVARSARFEHGERG